MDREILFRGKRVIDGKWVESCCPLGEMHSGTVTHDFIENTVCQYTGLTDKNGRKIFEGDIVETFMQYDDFRSKTERGILRYTHGMYEVEIEKCDGKPVYSDFMAGIALSGCPFEITVLGNIFDNPELLEGGES